MSPIDTKTLITALAALSQSIVQLDANVVHLARTYSGGAATNPAPPVDAAARPVATPVKPQAQPISAADADMRREQREFNTLLRKLLTDVAARRSGAARGGYSGRDIGRPRTGPVRPERGLGRNFDGLVATKRDFGKFRGKARTFLGVGKQPKAKGQFRPGAAKGIGGKLGGKLGGMAGGAIGAVVNVLAMPFQKIFQLLSPMSMMAQAINSSASGFQVFSSAVKVLAATFAPLLLPLFFHLAAGVVEASDVLDADLMPSLDEFFELCADGLIPTVYVLIEAFSFCTLAVREAAAILGDLTSQDPRRIMNRLNPIRDDFEIEDKVRGEGDFSGGERSRARDDTFKELRMSMGPKATLSGIAQAGRNVQLAALNASPFEQRILDRFNTAVNKLEAIDRNTTPRAGGRYESGDAGGNF